MWLLVFICDVRAGSFLVGEGYKAGAVSSDGTVVREEDETLRWSDYESRRVANGMAVKITFRCLKGHRTLHTNEHHAAQKAWTFLPLRGDRLEFDIALLFTATAFKRGLFRCWTIEELYAERDMYPKFTAVINSHPVFLASDALESLRTGVGMRVDSANSKLQQICTYVELFKWNTLYSFRRTMIQEVRRKHGTEYGKYAAALGQNSSAIDSCDEDSQADVDWVADWLNLSTMSRKETRKLYSHYVTARVCMPSDVTSVGA